MDIGPCWLYPLSKMLTGLSHLARAAKPWSFDQARNLLARTLRGRLAQDERDFAAALLADGKIGEALSALPKLREPVLFQTGYGASGLPHIGTFNEVARTTMVRAAFRALTDEAIPTRLISFSDDMDGLRKVPENVPNRALLELDLGKPLTRVRDPFGEHESLGRTTTPACAPFWTSRGLTMNSCPRRPATARDGSTRRCA